MVLSDESARSVDHVSREIMTGPMELPPRTFGPVPSRRFGRSLGLNTIPPKTCSYSCVYCQLGRTSNLTVKRLPHCDPGELYADVKRVLTRLDETGERVDYLTFVPDGEPTLDSRLGDQIACLKPFGVPIAVITNASLMSTVRVRRELALADRVSAKVDAVRHGSWRRIDRPHGDLRLEELLDGLLQFSREFAGELDTETMLVPELNCSPDELESLSAVLRLTRPRHAYLSAPVRPPAEPWVTMPDETDIVRAYDALSEVVGSVELLTGFEGSSFASTDDPRSDILAITAVHPMRTEQVETLLERTSSGWDVVEWLIRQGKVRQIEYNGYRYIVRRLQA